MPNTLTIENRWEIVFLARHRLGPKLNPAAIAKEVRCSGNTVRYWLKRYEETGDVLEEKSSGRPHCTTPKQDEKIVQMADSDPEASSE